MAQWRNEKKNSDFQTQKSALHKRVEGGRLNPFFMQITLNAKINLIAR
jgi:hypothetical protein